VISCIVVAIQHPERPQGTLKQASGSDRTERLSAVSAGPNGTLYWIDPIIGVATSPLFQRVTVGVLVSGALVYLGIKALQASRGVRVERAFQEIPPE
jgi:hypothetical protein